MWGGTLCAPAVRSRRETSSRRARDPACAADAHERIPVRVVTVKRPGCGRRGTGGRRAAEAIRRGGRRGGRLFPGRGRGDAVPPGPERVREDDDRALCGGI